MSIQNTLDRFGGDFQRPNRFRIQISGPGVGGEEIDVLGKSVQLPEITNTPIEIIYKGHKLEVPGRTNDTQTVTCTFYADDRMNLHRKFSSWLAGIDPKGYIQGIQGRYGSMTISAYNFDETYPSGTWKFVNVFPTSVSEIEFSSTEKDSVSEFTVTFSYFKYEE